MILIADSGSTKTHWRLVDDKKNIHQFSTVGFNPYFNDAQQIEVEIKKDLIPEIITKGINLTDVRIFYYGAGCSSDEKCGIVKEALSSCFKDSSIEIDHDLLGAARAICGNEKGIAAIVGTGSNSCYYDGINIVENVPSLGYILGDEGSGAHIGKTFLHAYFNKELPAHIAENFNTRNKLSREDILNAIYKKPMPSRFLASFSKFIFQNINDKYLENLVEKCFVEFFERQICKYSEHTRVKMGCVGSVAFYYSKILKRVAEQKGVVIDKIIESPVAALTLYHIENA